MGPGEPVDVLSVKQHTMGYFETFLRRPVVMSSILFIIAINLVPLMSVVAVISTFAYRRTGRVLPGALLCAILVTWYLVVGQATQAG